MGKKHISLLKILACKNASVLVFDTPYSRKVLGEVRLEGGIWNLNVRVKE